MASRGSRRAEEEEEILATRPGFLRTTPQVLPANLQAELESVGQAIDGLNEFLGPVDNILPADVQGELARAREILNELNLSTLTIIGERRFAEETEIILDTVSSAQDSPEEGAIVILRNVRSRIRGLRRIMDIERRFLSIGNPPGMLDSQRASLLNDLESALSDFGTNNQDRAVMTLAMMELYLEHFVAFDSQHMIVHRNGREAESLRDLLFDRIHTLGGQAREESEYDREDHERHRAFCQDIERQVETFDSNLRDNLIQRFGDYLGVINDQISLISDEEELRMLNELRRRIEELNNKLENPYERIRRRDILELSIEYFRLTGESPDLSEEEIVNNLGLRLRNLSASESGDVRAWANLARESLERNDYRSADLALMMASIMEISGNPRISQNRIDAIREAISSSEPLTTRQYEVWRRLADVGLLLAQIDRIRQEYPRIPQRRNESRRRGIFRERRDRYNDTADTAEDRLGEGRIEAARRLLQMSMQYLEILNMRSDVRAERRGNFPGHEQIEQALRREMEGENASELFNLGVNILTINQEADSLSERISRFRASERGTMGNYLSYIRSQAEENSRYARQLIGLARMYVESVEQMRTTGDGGQAASPGEEWPHDGVLEALRRAQEALRRAQEGPRSLENGEIATFITSTWQEARRIGSSHRLEELSERLEERCRSSDSTGARGQERRILDAVFERARTSINDREYGDADSLMNMLDDYFDSINQMWQGEPGYANARVMMLNAFQQIANAETVSAMSEAAMLFSRGLIILRETESLIHAAEGVSARVGLDADQLLSAAREGNLQGYSNALVELVDGSEGLSAEREAQMREMRGVLTQLGEERLPPQGSSESITAHDQVPSEERGMSLYDALNLWSMASDRAFTSRPEGGFPPFREFEALLARRDNLLQRLEGGAVGTQWTRDFNSLIFDSQRFYRRANAYMIVTREIEQNNQYLISVRGVTTGSSSAQRSEAEECLERAGGYLREARDRLVNGGMTDPVRNLINRRQEAEDLELQLANYTGWDTDQEYPQLRNRLDETELNWRENQELNAFLRGPSQLYQGAMQERKNAMNFWSPVISRGEQSFYVEQRAAFFDHVLFGEGDSEETEFRANDSRCLLLENGIFGLPANDISRVLDRLVHIAGMVGSRHGQPPRRTFITPSEARRRIEELADEQETGNRSFESTEEMQRALLVMTQSGEELSEMESAVEAMIGRQRYARIASHVGEFALGAALMPVNPLAGSAIFFTAAFRGAVTEFNTTGHVRPTTYAMLGGIALTMGIAGAARAFATAARAVRSFASATDEMYLIETAMRYGRAAHYLETTNFVFGIGFSAHMGHQAYLAAGHGAYPEAVMLAGMAAFPFVHMGANAVARRSGVSRVPRWMRVARQEYDCAIAENLIVRRGGTPGELTPEEAAPLAAEARAEATRAAEFEFFIRQELPRIGRALEGADSELARMRLLMRRASGRGEVLEAARRAGGEVESARNALRESFNDEIPAVERPLNSLTDSLGRLRQANDNLQNSLPEGPASPQGGVPQPVPVQRPAIPGSAETVGDIASIVQDAGGFVQNLASLSVRPDAPVSPEAAIGNHVLRNLPEPTRRIIYDYMPDAVARELNLGETDGLVAFIARLSRMNRTGRRELLDRLPSRVEGIIRDQLDAEPLRIVDQAAEEISDIVGGRPDRARISGELEEVFPPWMREAIQAGEGSGTPAQMMLTVDGNVIPRGSGRRGVMRAEESGGSRGAEETTSPSIETNRGRGLGERLRSWRRSRRTARSESGEELTTDYQRFLDIEGLTFANRLASEENTVAVEDAVYIIIRLYEMHGRHGPNTESSIRIIRKLCSFDEVRTALESRNSDVVTQIIQEIRRQLGGVPGGVANGRMRDFELLPDQIHRVVAEGGRARDDVESEAQRMASNIRDMDLSRLIHDVRGGTEVPRLLTPDEVRLINDTFESDSHLRGAPLEQVARRMFGRTNEEGSNDERSSYITLLLNDASPSEIASAQAYLIQKGFRTRGDAYGWVGRYQTEVSNQLDVQGNPQSGGVVSEVRNAMRHNITNPESPVSTVSESFRSALNDEPVQTALRRANDGELPEWHSQITGEGGPTTLREMRDAIFSGGTLRPSRAVDRQLHSFLTALSGSNIDGLLGARNTILDSIPEPVSTGTPAAAALARRHGRYLPDVDVAGGFYRTVGALRRLLTFRTLPGPGRAFRRFYPSQGAGSLRLGTGAIAAAGSVAGNAMITGIPWSLFGLGFLYGIDQLCWQDSRRGRVHAREAYRQAARRINEDYGPGVVFTEDRSFLESMLERGEETALDAGDAWELGRILYEGTMPIHLSEENAEFLNTPDGRGLIDQLLDVEGYPLSQLRVRRGTSVEDGAQTLREMLSWDGTGSPPPTVVDPERLNDLVTEVRRILSLNQLCEEYQQTDDEAEQSEIHAQAYAICSEVGLITDEMLDISTGRRREQGQEITVGWILNNMRERWVEEGYLRTKSDFIAELFALDTGIPVGVQNSTVEVFLPVVNERLSEFQNTHAEGNLRRICRMLSLDYNEIITDFGDEGELSEERIDEYRDHTDIQGRESVEWLSNHPEVLIFLWEAYSRGHVPRSYIAEAVLRFRTEEETQDLGTTGSAYINHPLDLSINQSELSGYHRQYIDVLEKDVGGETLYLDPPIPMDPDAFLERIDWQGVSDPDMRQEFRRILEDNFGGPNWDRIREFRIPENYAIYGDTEEGSRTLRGMVEIIADSDTESEAIQQLLEDGYIEPPLYTVEGSPRYLYNLDQRFRWDREAVDFVYTYSNGNRRGLARWFSDNWRGVEGHAHDIVGHLEGEHISQDILNDPDRLERYLDNRVGTPEGPGPLFQYWNGQIPTPIETRELPPEPPSRTVRDREPIQGRNAPGAISAARTRASSNDPDPSQDADGIPRFSAQISEGTNDDTLNNFVQTRLVAMAGRILLQEGRYRDYARKFERFGLVIGGRLVEREGGERQLRDFEIIPLFAFTTENEEGDTVFDLEAARDHINEVVPEGDRRTEAIRLAERIDDDREAYLRRFNRFVNDTERVAPPVRLDPQIVGREGIINQVLDDRNPPIQDPSLRAFLRSKIMDDLKANVFEYRTRHMFGEDGVIFNLPLGGGERGVISIATGQEHRAEDFINNLVPDFIEEYRPDGTNQVSQEVFGLLDTLLEDELEEESGIITRGNRDRVGANVLEDMRLNRQTYIDSGYFELEDGELVISTEGQGEVEEGGITHAQQFLQIRMLTVVSGLETSEEESE